MNVTASPLEFILSGRAEKATPTTRPLIEAQRLELLARYARHEEQYVLRPGDLVAEKEGLSFFPAESAGKIALMLWRFLDPDNFSDQCVIEQYSTRTKNFDRLDCMLAWIDQEGNGLEIMPYSIKKLRPLNEDERSAVQAVLDHPAGTAS